MINWKVRIRNLDFWLAFVPALLLVIQSVAALFGFKLDLSATGEGILGVINAVFGLLALLGIVNDPTTAGLADSKLAQTYDRPKTE